MRSKEGVRHIGFSTYSSCSSNLKSYAFSTLLGPIEMMTWTRDTQWHGTTMALIDLLHGDYLTRIMNTMFFRPRWTMSGCYHPWGGWWTRALVVLPLWCLTNNYDNTEAKASTLRDDVVSAHVLRQGNAGVSICFSHSWGWMSWMRDMEGTIGSKCL
jgi:hypothetical protein